MAEGPFPPDDPIYGQRAPDNADFVFLGQLGVQGERGLLDIPFAPSTHCSGKVMTARDNTGAVRYLDPGNLRAGIERFVAERGERRERLRKLVGGVLETAVEA